MTGIRKVFALVTIVSSALALLVWVAFGFLLFAGSQPGRALGMMVAWPVVFGMSAAGYYVSYIGLTSATADIKWDRLLLFVAMTAACLGVPLIGLYATAELLGMWFKGSASV